MIEQRLDYLCSYRFLKECGYVVYDFYHKGILFDRDKCTQQEMMDRFLKLKEAPAQGSLL